MSKLMIKGTEVGFSLEDANVETTELARCTTTTQTQYTVNDLSQYDFISFVQYSDSTASYAVSSHILTYKQFAKANFRLDSLFGTGSNATVVYVNDTTVKMSNNTANRMEVLYGIKIKAMALPVKEMHRYSTDEQVVGVWLDGKPLYERTFEAELPTGYRDFAWMSPFIVEDADMFFVENAFAYEIGGLQMIQFINATTNYDVCFTYISLNTGRIWLKKGSGVTVNRCVVTFRYTKTTDTPTALSLDSALEVANTDVADILNSLGD